MIHETAQDFNTDPSRFVSSFLTFTTGPINNGSYFSNSSSIIPNPSTPSIPLYTGLITVTAISTFSISIPSLFVATSTPTISVISIPTQTSTPGVLATTTFATTVSELSTLIPSSEPSPFPTPQITTAQESTVKIAGLPKPTFIGMLLIPLFVLPIAILISLYLVHRNRKPTQKIRTRDSFQRPLLPKLEHVSFASNRQIPELGHDDVARPGFVYTKSGGRKRSIYELMALRRQTAVCELPCPEVTD
ncbi:hypothetical protein G7Y89_g13870 [Cudoniella acicularis]|uniref:Uncharacterized protein n=1 Tax=Cudoniella acicularis TaxID=354080 RepID=A0A8H4R8G4_9HELO|nr:hypothetical protein G7Y89_g13870 [Cudoniella acicularis]